jgi:hypothetical protein
VLREHSSAVTNVLPQSFKHPATLHVVSFVNGSIHVAKTAERPFARHIRRHARLDVFFSLQLNVRAHFAIDIVDYIIALSQSPQSIAE